ncbi:MAG: SulP family inorganic anion transporter [Kineosporiaceae bacterium]
MPRDSVRGRFARRRAAAFDLEAEPDLPWRRRLAGFVPGLIVLRNYERRWLRADVFAGVAVAAYLVPQVMAYASIVDVPPVVGLWTALAACIAYAVLGCSRVLSAGPESTVALMAGVVVAPLSGGDPERAAALTAALSLVVAGWVLLARLARLGVVADLLSQPLLVGYLAGGAVLMVLGQLGASPARPCTAGASRIRCVPSSAWSTTSTGRRSRWLPGR